MFWSSLQAGLPCIVQASGSLRRDFGSIYQCCWDCCPQSGKQRDSLIRFWYDFKQMKANTLSQPVFLEKHLDVSANLVLQQERGSSWIICFLDKDDKQPTCSCIYKIESKCNSTLYHLFYIIYYLFYFHYYSLLMTYAFLLETNLAYTINLALCIIGSYDRLLLMFLICKSL